MAFCNIMTRIKWGTMWVDATTFIGQKINNGCGI